jgi:hypothetical protein
MPKSAADAVEQEDGMARIRCFNPGVALTIAPTGMAWAQSGDPCSGQV